MLFRVGALGRVALDSCNNYNKYVFVTQSNGFCFSCIFMRGRAMHSLLYTYMHIKSFACLKLSIMNHHYFAKQKDSSFYLKAFKSAEASRTTCRKLKIY